MMMNRWTAICVCALMMIAPLMAAGAVVPEESVYVSAQANPDDVAMYGLATATFVVEGPLGAGPVTSHGTGASSTECGGLDQIQRCVEVESWVEQRGKSSCEFNETGVENCEAVYNGKANGTGWLLPAEIELVYVNTGESWTCDTGFTTSCTVYGDPVVVSFGFIRYGVRDCMDSDLVTPDGEFAKYHGFGDEHDYPRASEVGPVPAKIKDICYTAPDRPSPSAQFASNCSHLDCTFDGSNSHYPYLGSIESYDWGLGDGSTATGETVSHTYASEGTYSVTLTVTSNDGTKDSKTKEISVSEPSGDDDPGGDEGSGRVGR